MFDRVNLDKHKLDNVYMGKCALYSWLVALDWILHKETAVLTVNLVKSFCDVLVTGRRLRCAMFAVLQVSDVVIYSVMSIAPV